MASDPHVSRDKFKDRLAELINTYRASLVPQTGREPGEDGPGKQQQSIARLSLVEIKARQALLQKDPQLLRLHRDLVRSGHLTEEEFWETRSDLLESQLRELSQSVGLSSELLHDIRPTSTEGTDIKYTLTPQDIKSIFLHYPSLKRAYDANVPEKMSETDFWKRCFQSSFFYRDRNVKGKQDQIFDKAAEEEEEELKKETWKFEMHNFLLDLTEAELMDEYPTELDSTAKFTQKNSVPLVRRFNKHGEIVVRTHRDSKFDTKERHKQILRDVLKLEDLQMEIPTNPVPLKLKNQDQYFQSVENDKEIVSEQQWQESARNVYKVSVDKINGRIEPDPNKCLEILNNYSTFDQNEKHASVADAVGGDTLQDIITLNMNASEILRHFWSCIPPNKSEEAARKFMRMERLLETISERLNEFKDPKQRRVLDSITNSLNKAQAECLKYK